MEKYIKELHDRYKEVQRIFDGFPIDPTQVKNFKTFLEEHVANIAGNYVILGKFEAPKSTTEEPNPRAGMAVASVPLPGEGKLKDEDEIYYKGDA